MNLPSESHSLSVDSGKVFFSCSEVFFFVLFFALCFFHFVFREQNNAEICQGRNYRRSGLIKKDGQYSGETPCILEVLVVARGRCWRI